MQRCGYTLITASSNQITVSGRKSVFHFLFPTFILRFLPVEALVELEDILQKAEGEVDTAVEGSAEHSDPGPAHDQGYQGGVGNLGSPS